MIENCKINRKLNCLGAVVSLPHSSPPPPGDLILTQDPPSLPQCSHFVLSKTDPGVWIYLSECRVCVILRYTYLCYYQLIMYIIVKLGQCKLMFYMDYYYSGSISCILYKAASLFCTLICKLIFCQVMLINMGYNMLLNADSYIHKPQIVFL